MRRVALLVGNSQFSQDSKIHNLRFPSKDVEALEITLKDPGIGRYDRVVTLINKRSDEIILVLTKMLNEERGASFLFYFSGHGMPSDGGRLYLAASNTTVDLLPGTGVSFGAVLQIKDDFGFGRFAVILDCCYAGLGGPDVKGSEDDQLRAYAGGRGVFFLGAASATEAAKEDEALGHGVLTAGILEGLKTGLADVDNDGRVTSSDLFNWCGDFSSRRGSHKPVQVNRVEDGDLIIAFSRRRISADVIERVRSKLVVAWENRLLASADLEYLRRYFVDTNLVLTPPSASLPSAFLAYCIGEIDWDEFQSCRLSSSPESGRKTYRAKTSEMIADPLGPETLDTKSTATELMPPSPAALPEIIDSSGLYLSRWLLATQGAFQAGISIYGWTIFAGRDGDDTFLLWWPALSAASIFASVMAARRTWGALAACLIVCLIGGLFNAFWAIAASFGAFMETNPGVRWFITVLWISSVLFLLGYIVAFVHVFRAYRPRLLQNSISAPTTPNNFRSDDR